MCQPEIIFLRYGSTSSVIIDYRLSLVYLVYLLVTRLELPEELVLPLYVDRVEKDTECMLGIRTPALYPG